MVRYAEQETRLTRDVSQYQGNNELSNESAKLEARICEAGGLNLLNRY